MNQNSFRNLVAGTDQPLHKKVLRLCLILIASAYKLVIRLRNYCYDNNWLKAHSVDVPVISVGNITVGGTGKTPLVARLCNLLEKKSIKCAILTRGYKTPLDKLTDEPAILAKSCPSAAIIINPDRKAGAEKAIREHSPSVLLMDDGFQHRKLKRDLDIITIDATCPFGFDRMLPAGLLREPPDALKRAHAVVITHANHISDSQLIQLEHKIKQINPDIIVAKAAYKHPCAKTMKARTILLDELKGKNVFAFCGIANPQPFLASLKQLQINLLGSKIYNDHHCYTEQDITDIYDQAKVLEASLVLSTEKDWVKTALLSQKKNDITFAYLVLELDFVEGFDKIETLIDKVLNK